MHKQLLFILFLVGWICSPMAFADTPVKGGVLTVAQLAEPPGLDPTANTAAAIDRVVWSNIYETLGEDGRPGSFAAGSRQNVGCLRRW